MDDPARDEARGRLGSKLRLTVITDRGLAAPSDLADVVAAALRGGATCIQLRDKGATSRDLLASARTLRSLISEHSEQPTLFIVNDRVDIALAVGADGVHLGDDDLPVREVRRVVPRRFIIGRSADTVATARRAEEDGADYLGVGSVFGTRTKKEVVGEKIGTDRLARVVGSVAIPCIGIGGVTAENAGSVIQAGAVGVAVASAVMSATDPEAATRAIMRRIANRE